MRTLTDFEIGRSSRIIRDTISLLKLDLSGYQVLTEAGSGFFALTPIIAAMANADRVYAWTRDSAHGDGADVAEACGNLASRCGFKAVIEFAVNCRPKEHIYNANIITNLGFVRPIDSTMLSCANLESKPVIPIMCEAWETRARDVDVPYCRSMGFKIAGTWENHPSIRVFDSCGSLAIKMAMNAGYEVSNNRIIVWSSDDFGLIISQAFLAQGASVVTTVDVQELYDNATNSDFIFFCDYRETGSLITNNSLIDVSFLRERNPSLGIIHLYGDIDHNICLKQGLHVYPRQRGFPMTMTMTLADLGMVPMIRLHTAGLKVGQELLSGKLTELSQPL